MAWRTIPSAPRGPVLPLLGRRRSGGPLPVRPPGILRPLRWLPRGLRRQWVWLRTRWAAVPAKRRGPALLVAAFTALTIAVAPHGPAAALAVLLGVTFWAGRDRAPHAKGPHPAEDTRLRSLYEALTPYFSASDATGGGLYSCEGTWRAAFAEHRFDSSGRLTMLRLRYPGWFTDQESGARARVERVLQAKAGRGREYRFTWDEQGNELLLTALEPLPTDIPAQRFVTGPAETVLGFTDTTATRRTIPVTTDSGETRQEPPLIWRTGPRSAEPHLLVFGQPGSGCTTLLRSLAFQALEYGDLIVLDGAGSGEYACLADRPGVLAVESGAAGALTALEWAAHETERRLIGVSRARQAGRPAPADARRPLWIIVDRPSSLSHLAAVEGRKDPQVLLDTPLRHGRAAAVTVAVADTVDCAEALYPALHTHCRAKVALGALSRDRLSEVLGAAPATTPAEEVPPGRGHARLGRGPVERLQVPTTPDPWDEETEEARRRALLALLPPHSAAPGVGVQLPSGPAVRIIRRAGRTAQPLRKNTGVGRPSGHHQVGAGLQP